MNLAHAFRIRVECGLIAPLFSVILRHSAEDGRIGCIIGRACVCVLKMGLIESRHKRVYISPRVSALTGQAIDEA